MDSTHLTQSTSYWLLGIAAVILLLAFPLIFRDPYFWGILVMANIYAAFGVCFDLLLGFTGLAVLGFGLFVGVGGYTAAFLNLSFGAGPWLTLPAAGIVGATFGLLIGLPCLRLRGLYLTMATFAAAAICEKLVTVFNEYTYGWEGLSGLEPIAQGAMASYYASLILLLATVSLLLGIVRSRTGLILKSICDDDIAAEGVGIATNRYKLFAFLLGSFLGGLWGGFFAHYMMHVGPEFFGIRVAITIFMVTIVGGVGTIIGSIGGAYLLILLSELLREIGEVRLLIYAAFSIFIYLLMPQGILLPMAAFIVRGMRGFWALSHKPKEGIKTNVLS